MNSNTTTTTKPVYEGMSIGEAVRNGAIETMDGRLVDSSGRSMTDGGSNPLRNDGGTVRKD